MTTGLTGVAWPTEVVTGKIAVLGARRRAREAVRRRS